VTLALGGAVLLGWLLVRRVRPRWVRRRAARAEAEPAYFARFGRACRTSDAHPVYVALLAWLDRFGPMGLDEFTARAGDPALSDAVSDLNGRTYVSPASARPDAGWSGRPLYDRAAAARRRLRPARRGTAAAPLPPLNP
jgi:hypothetical protein